MHRRSKIEDLDPYIVGTLETVMTLHFAGDYLPSWIRESRVCKLVSQLRPPLMLRMDASHVKNFRFICPLLF